MLGIAFFGAVSLAQAAPTASPPTPTPLKVIGHERTSALCTLLHENIARSVGDVLLNDAAIDRAGDAVAGMIISINSHAGDTTIDPTSGRVVDMAPDDSLWLFGDPNPGVAMAEIKLLAIGGQIVRNSAEIDRLLADPRFADPANAQGAAIKADLQRVEQQQTQMENVIFAIAYTEHPANILWYPDPIRQEIQDVMQHAPRNAETTNVFSALGAIANANIVRTHVLENAAAGDIMTVARLCR